MSATQKCLNCIRRDAGMVETENDSTPPGDLRDCIPHTILRASPKINPSRTHSPSTAQKFAAKAFLLAIFFCTRNLARRILEDSGPCRRPRYIAGRAREEQTGRGNQRQTPYYFKDREFGRLLRAKGHDFYDDMLPMNLRYSVTTTVSVTKCILESICLDICFP